jgi:hypothetical protein
MALFINGDPYLANKGVIDGMTCPMTNGQLCGLPPHKALI